LRTESVIAWHKWRSGSLNRKLASMNEWLAVVGAATLTGCFLIAGAIGLVTSPMRDPIDSDDDTDDHMRNMADASLTKDLMDWLD